MFYVLESIIMVKLVADLRQFSWQWFISHVAKSVCEIPPRHTPPIPCTVGYNDFNNLMISPWNIHKKVFFFAVVCVFVFKVCKNITQKIVSVKNPFGFYIKTI